MILDYAFFSRFTSIFFIDIFGIIKLMAWHYRNVLVNFDLMIGRFLLVVLVHHSKRSETSRMCVLTHTLLYTI